jgi:hypothetical protein
MIGHIQDQVLAHDGQADEAEITSCLVCHDRLPITEK